MLKRFFKNLVFPPKCMSCGDFAREHMLDFDGVPFCRKCYAQWEREKHERCGNCGLEICICNCGTPFLDKCEVEHCLKLIKYSAKKESVGKNVVFYMKKKRNKDAFDFIAKQLSVGIMRKVNELSVKNGVILYVPRGISGMNKYGFDQANELAKRVSTLTEMELIPLFHKNKTVKLEQKKLRLKSRLELAKGAFSINEDKLKHLKGRDCAFIIDDVMTSGASLGGCVMRLKSRFRGKIVCVTVAKTGKSVKNPYSVLQFS